MGAQLPVWRCVRGVQQLPWAPGGHKQGMESFSAFPHLLMPGWVFEMLVPGAGPTQHPTAFQCQPLTRAALLSLLPCALPMSCIPGAAVTLLQHRCLGKTRGVSAMPSLPSVLVNV